MAALFIKTDSLRFIAPSIIHSINISWNNFKSGLTYLQYYNRRFCGFVYFCECVNEKFGEFSDDIKLSFFRVSYP